MVQRNSSLRLFHLTFVLALVCALLPVPAVAAPPPPNLIEDLRAQTGEQLRVSYHPTTGQVRFLGTTPDQAIPLVRAQGVQDPTTALAYQFATVYGPLFGVQNPQTDLAVTAAKTTTDGREITRFQQRYQGIPILGGELLIQAKAEVGVIAAAGKILPELAVDVTPKVAAEEATRSALQKVAKTYSIDPATLFATAPSLRIYNPMLFDSNAQNQSHLAWELLVTDADVLQVKDLMVVDAHSGKILLHVPQLTTARHRVIYDHGNDSTLGLPGGAPVRNEGGAATGNVDVDRAYDYLGDTYDFFQSRFAWDSLDNAGMSLIATVRACAIEPCPYQNAFWNGQQMVFGQGFAQADDVVGHELTHGLIDHTAHLFYSFESGAINESLADVFGEFIDQTNGQGDDRPAVRWQMGEESPLGAIRDMRDPTQFGDPDRIGSANYFCEFGDNGGVHINSGVNNKAAALLTDGGSFNGKQVTALGINNVAALYFEAMTNLLLSGSDYADLADALTQAAINLGLTASQRQSVANAIAAVEMRNRPCSKPADPALCPTNQSPVLSFWDDLENSFSNKWQSAVIAGSNSWYYPPTPNPYDVDPANTTSGVYNLWGDNQAARSDSVMAMSRSIQVPSAAFLAFQQSWEFENSGGRNYDGGIVEYSTNNGSSWQDATSLFVANGYNGTITSAEDNPLAGRSAFVNRSRGYRLSKLNLQSLAGKSVRFRFRLATDSSVGDFGWFIDDLLLYHCTPGNSRPLFEALPAKRLAMNQPTPQLIDLWNYAVDVQDVDASLVFSITNSPDINAGVTVNNNRYLSVNPSLDWTGTTTVRLEVADTGGLTNTTSVQIAVADLYQLYLPVIARAKASRLPDSIFAVEDAVVVLPEPTSTFCQDTLLVAGNRYRSLLKFNVSEIPRGTPLRQVTLDLYLADSFDIPGTVRNVSVYRVNSQWTSCSVTWNGQPAIGEELARIPVAFSSDEWIRFDITGLVRDWVDGRTPNFGIIVYENSAADVDPSYRAFASLNSALPPRLTVAYTGLTAAAVAEEVAAGLAAAEVAGQPAPATVGPYPAAPLCDEATVPGQYCLLR